MISILVSIFLESHFRGSIFIRLGKLIIWRQPRKDFNNVLTGMVSMMIYQKGIRLEIPIFLETAYIIYYIIDYIIFLCLLFFFSITQLISLYSLAAILSLWHTFSFSRHLSLHSCLFFYVLVGGRNFNENFCFVHINLLEKRNKCLV